MIEQGMAAAAKAGIGKMLLRHVACQIKKPCINIFFCV